MPNSIEFFTQNEKQRTAINTLISDFGVYLREEAEQTQAIDLLEAIEFIADFPARNRDKTTPEKKQCYFKTVQDSLDLLKPFLQKENKGWAHYAYFSLATDSITRAAYAARAVTGFAAIFKTLIEASENALPAPLLEKMLGPNNLLHTKWPVLKTAIAEIKEKTSVLQILENELEQKRSAQRLAAAALADADPSKTLAPADTEEISALKVQSQQQSQQLHTLQEEAQQHCLELLQRTPNYFKAPSPNFRDSTWLFTHVFVIEQLKQINSAEKDKYLSCAYDQIVRTFYLSGKYIAIFYREQAHQAGLPLDPQTQRNFNKKYPAHEKPLVEIDPLPSALLAPAPLPTTYPPTVTSPPNRTENLALKKEGNETGCCVLL